MQLPSYPWCSYCLCCYYYLAISMLYSFKRRTSLIVRPYITRFLFGARCWLIRVVMAHRVALIGCVPHITNRTARYRIALWVTASVERDADWLMFLLTVNAVINWGCLRTGYCTEQGTVQNVWTRESKAKGKRIYCVDFLKLYVTYHHRHHHNHNHHYCHQMFSSTLTL